MKSVILAQKKNAQSIRKKAFCLLYSLETIWSHGSKKEYKFGPPLGYIPQGWDWPWNIFFQIKYNEQFPKISSKLTQWMQRYFHFYNLTLGAYNSQRGNNEVPKFSKSINNFDNLSNHTRIKLVHPGSAFYLIKNLARNLYHVKFDTLCYLCWLYAGPGYIIYQDCNRWLSQIVRRVVM